VQLERFFRFMTDALGIKTHLQPDRDNALDLGQTAAQWRKLYLSGQLISSLATGTAPFSVASTTKVTNLNADTVDGIEGHAAITLGDATIQAVLDLSTQALTLDSQAANTALMGPVSGAAAAPAFRAPVAADMPAAIGAAAYNSVNMSITKDAWAYLTLDSEYWDSDSCHDLVTNNSRLTCNTAGKYLVTATIFWNTSATGHRWLRLLVGRSTILVTSREVALASDITVSTVTTIADLAAGNYVEMQVLQNSGGDLAVLADAGQSPRLSMIRFGA